MTIKSMNKYLQLQEPSLQVVKGKGYFYFLTNDGRFTPTSIYTQNSEFIYKEDLDLAIEEYQSLKNTYYK